MPKKLISAAMIAATMTVSAQLADVSAPQRLLQGVQSDMYYPELSADGMTLTFSDLQEKNFRQYDYAAGSTLQVAERPTKAKAKNGVTARVDHTNLIINIGGQESTYSPVECYAGYLWPSVSPDGTKVMFVAAGKGVYITDLKGNVLAHPGRYEAPVWFGNDHIVVMKATDDGHQFESSQIILMTLDGSQTQALTRPESMAMFPTASIDANRVVYNTIDGRLYQLDVTLK